MKSSTTSSPCPGALKPQSIITQEHCDITDISYSIEAHQYCSSQSSVFYHILLNDDVNNFLSFNISIKRFMRELGVEESCLLSSGKKSGTLHDVDMILWMSLFMSVVMH